MKTGVAATAALVAWCALAPPPARAAVADYVGKTVASVRIVIDGHDTSDPQLTQVVETLVGQPLSMLHVRESVTHLFTLGLFDDVRVDATLEDGRVALRYDLVPTHVVSGIRFQGNLGGVDQGALRRAITDRYGMNPPLGRARDMARIITDFLSERGYLHATATPLARTAAAADRAALVFEVDMHERTLVGTVTIDGRPTVAQDEFIKRLGLAARAPYERDALNARIERYVEERRRAGYYEARIVPDAQLVDDDRTANITLKVTPGQHARIVFAGDPPPSEKREDLVPVEREGSVDEDLLEDASNRIEEALRAQGYRDAKAPHTRSDTGGELIITFTIKRGPLYRVASYTFTGNTTLARSEFEAGLRLREGQPFAESRLDADLSAVEESYRRRGFATVKAQPAIQLQTPAAGSSVVPVVVQGEILEGVRTVVQTVSFDGNTAFDDGALRAKIKLKPGEPYVPGQLIADRDAIEVAYQDLGYQSVTVQATPMFSADRGQADVQFEIRENSRVFVEHILIVGNVRTSTETIERELRIKPGDPLSLAALNESQRRLTALGLFRRARITEVKHSGENVRDLVVTIEEAPPMTISYGGGVEGRLRPVRSADTGVETERFEVAPRASFEISRRNLFGKNRSVSFFANASLPRNFGTADVSPDSTTNVAEYRVGASFREPRLFNTNAEAFVTAITEQQIRSSFDFSRRSVTASITKRLTPRVIVTGAYQLQRTLVFAFQGAPEDQLLIDRTFPQYLLSSFSASIVRDTRNDAVDPSHGEMASANGQIAGQAIGSEVGFVKSYFTGEMFRTVPRARRVIVAGRAQLGLANGFSLDGQLKAPERFYAGGDTTARGFAIDQLGVRHEPARSSDTIDQDGFPIGGNALVLFNLEARVAVGRGIQLVPFVDTGNVFAHVSNIDLGEFRTSVGAGVRYKSPIGPLRVDVGFKVHPQTFETVVNQPPPLPPLRTSSSEGRLAWFISFGQAF